jgi:hypothetical protein
MGLDFPTTQQKPKTKILTTKNTNHTKKTKTAKNNQNPSFRPIEVVEGFAAVLPESMRSLV